VNSRFESCPRESDGRWFGLPACLQTTAPIQNAMPIPVTVAPFQRAMVGGIFAAPTEPTLVLLRTVNQKQNMQTNNTAKSPAPVPMTVRDASRIYSATAGQNHGAIPKGSFAARAMSAAMTSANASGTKGR